MTFFLIYYARIVNIVIVYEKNPQMTKIKNKKIDVYSFKVQF